MTHAATAAYNQNQRDRARAVKAANEIHAALVRAADIQLERAIPQGFRQQLQEWRDAQVAAIDEQARQALANANPEAAAVHAQAVQEADWQRDVELEAAAAAFEAREAERKAGAAQARREADKAAYEASPAGQDRARRAALEDALDRLLASWGLPSHYWTRRSWADDVRIDGQAHADAEWARTAPYREICLAADPTTAAAFEDQTGAALEAAIRRWEAKHGMTRHAAYDKATAEVGA